MHSCNDGIINSHNYHAGQFFVWWCNYYFSEFLYIKFIYLFNVYYNSMVEGAKHAGLHIHVAPNPLRWRHNWRDSVSNHQPHDCLIMRLFRRRSKKTSKVRVTGLCAVNSLETGEFPTQMASNAKVFPFEDVIMIFGENLMSSVPCCKLWFGYECIWTCFLQNMFIVNKTLNRNVYTVPMKYLSSMYFYYCNLLEVTSHVYLRHIMITMIFFTLSLGDVILISLLKLTQTAVFHRVVHFLFINHSSHVFWYFTQPSSIHID